MGSTRMLSLAVAVPALVLAVGTTMGAAAGEDGQNVPVIQHVSTPVKQNDLEFQIVADSIWPMPARTGKSGPDSHLATGASPVQFRLRVTNYGKKELRFISMVGMPILRGADGKEYEVHFLGNDHISMAERVSLAPGKTITVLRSANLFTDGHLFTRDREITWLGWEDESGANWNIDNLKPGEYLLRLQYNTRWNAQNSSDPKWAAWIGDVCTAEVPIKIVELKGSEPAVSQGMEAIFSDGAWHLEKAAERGWKDDVEVSAAAEAVWKAPAAGKQTQFCLGFRMAAVKERWVRIMPSIAAVTIKSVDGVELPIKKAAARVSIEAPSLVTLHPEYSHTVATSACLFRNGKTMTLAWADRTGQVWRVESLRPGWYEIGYIIRAEKGEPNPHISYWVGELRPPPVMVEIKE